MLMRKAADTAWFSRKARKERKHKSQTRKSRIKEGARLWFVRTSETRVLLEAGVLLKLQGGAGEAFLQAPLRHR